MMTPIPYQLSDDERALLIPALERAENGEFVRDEDVTVLLEEPWR